ncbi:glutamate--tRNA ligase family protein [Echinicola soli]|nr:glutamate--tRNA ligase family protein [Echinicola soli]
MKTYRLTRIAPTPSGFLHLGNALSFAITYALAKRHGTKIMLRIDDLDQNRVKMSYVEDLFDTLRFLDFPWHYGPRNVKEYQDSFSQIHRMPLYHKVLDQLVGKNLVYACQCSRKKIAQSSPDGSYPGTCRAKHIGLGHKQVNWRLKTDQRPLTMQMESNELVSPLPAIMKDFIIRKKDGAPSYQLASVVDDIHYGVDLIVRGDDLQDSSWTQLFIADLLPENQFSKGTFYHHPLLMDNGEHKLSKSAGSTSIHGLRKLGKSKEAIYQQLGVFMGFSESVFSLEEFERAFNQKRLP